MQKQKKNSESEATVKILIVRKLTARFNLKKQSTIL